MASVLQSESPEYWQEMWEKGQTGWQRDFIDPALEVSM